MSDSTLLAVANNTEGWALIPSDPGNNEEFKNNGNDRLKFYIPAIFNDMLQEYGTKDVKVQEVYSLDFDDLTSEGPIYGMIFASECNEEILPDDFDQVDPEAEHITYTSQIITNICGTLALLTILFNVDVFRGEILENFLEFTKGFNHIDRGMALGNSPIVNKIHNSYTISQHQNDSRMIDIDMDDENEELFEATNYHYVSYIYKIGYIWELDGLKGRPIKLTECNENNWLETLKPILEKRMNASNDEAIAFNLMAVTHDNLAYKKNEANTYEDCIIQVDKVKELENHLTEIEKDVFFTANANMRLAGYSIMQELWTARIQQEEIIVAEKIAKLNELKDTLKNEILSVEADKDLIMADVNRSKFDYFPFLEQLFRVAHEKDLLEKHIEFSKDKSATLKNSKSKGKQKVASKVVKKIGRKPKKANK